MGLRKGHINSGSFKKGQTSWIKGKKKDDHPSVKRISERMKGNKNWDNPNSKMTQFKKGVIPWNRGINMWKNKKPPIGMKGKKMSNAHKNKIFNKKFRESLIKRMKENNPMKNEAIVQKSVKGRKDKQNLINQKISITKKRLYKEGKIVSPNKGKNKNNSLIFKKISEMMKKGGAIKARMANQNKPNKPEKMLTEIIEKNNLFFNYVGDGKVWFKGETQRFNPDFINKEQRKIIELFGDYWHRLPEKGKIDEERLKTYSQAGFETLIIWEHELKGPEKVIQRIRDFFLNG